LGLIFALRNKKRWGGGEIHNNSNKFTVKSFCFSSILIMFTWWTPPNTPVKKQSTDNI